MNVLVFSVTFTTNYHYQVLLYQPIFNPYPLPHTRFLFSLCRYTFSCIFLNYLLLLLLLLLHS